MRLLERILIKLIVCQIIFLFVAQYLIFHWDIGTYFNRLYEYEGITNGSTGETVETIDRSNFLWYDERVKN
ncbi:YpfB family protein [Bacillus sp. Marseille-Q3570]|uniref:YpfB family protein n=1 Tax=Bacillus sp. Marseille-Q3570 TaxID=2963522 RepID=UPI0021B7F9CE|nr:YpfB family protein [Bacillus sp. Marseille-Q3570]